MDEMTDFQKDPKYFEVHSQGQVHWSVTNQIRHAAFSSAMDIHRHRETSHDEIIASARAFEAYLKGD